MPTNEEYRRIAQSMKSVLQLANNPDVIMANIVFALGTLHGHIDMLNADDPLWQWWLKFRPFIFAMSVRPDERL